MVYLVLGMAVLALGLMALRGFAQANPASVARRLRIGGGTVALLSAGLLLVRGLEAIAIPLGMFGSWLIWGRPLPPWLGGGGNTRRTPGQASRVETDHLEMELDHDTGEMRGRVLSMVFTLAQLGFVGILAVGALADVVGDQVALGIFGAIPTILLTGLLAFGWKTLKQM